MIIFGITTYNRPDKCLSLLKDICQEFFNHEDFRIIVVNDGSNKDYSSVERFLGQKKIKFSYLSKTNNLGRRWYYMTHNLLMNTIKEYSCDYVCILPDDVKLVFGFREGIKKLSEIESAAAINLLNVTGGKCVTQWSRRDVHEFEYNGIELLTSGYVDMAMLIKGSVYSKLNPITGKSVSSTGSGVGREYTHQLNNYGEIYQVKHSFLIHGKHKSKLNTDERLLNPLISNHKNGWCRKK